uniref:Transposase (Putative), gypsy type n=1 Tax=Tanacetum cinerariifolium TaxID=118510 RepID=A0A699KMB5_TANCI|nr:hypothetical protein [Tanacetum cinerariifolium]
MSTVSDPPIITTAVTTTIAVETSLVSVSKVKVKPINSTLFGDSMLTSGHDVSGPSSPIHPELSVDSFYAIQDLNPETLHRTCLCVKVQMREEHILRKKKILEEECVHQTNLLKEKDVEIANLKSQLSLKEAEAAEAIRLRDHVATVEATKALHVAELNLLKERNYTLEAKMRAFEEKAAALKSEKSSLTDQTTCVKLHNQDAGYELFKEQIEAVQDEQVRVLTEKIAKVDANLMRIELQLDDEFYHSYHTTIVGRRWILSLSALRDVDFSLLTLLASQKDASIADIMDSLRLEGSALAEVIHNRIQRIRGDVEARRLSFSDAMVPLIEPLSFENLLGEASTSGVPVTGTAIETLDASELQPSHEQLMLSIHRPKTMWFLRKLLYLFPWKLFITAFRGSGETQRHKAYLFLMLWFHS